jgi:hypothetical protein
MFFEQSVWSELRSWFSIYLNPKSTEPILTKFNIDKEEDVNIKSCWAVLILVHTGSV